MTFNKHPFRGAFVSMAGTGSFGWGARVTYKKQD
jgi:hypothetical protein